MPHQLFLTSIPHWCGTSASPESLRDSALGYGLAEHPPGVGEALPYNLSVPLAEALGPYAEQVEGALVPHQLFLANIPLWCGTSARGAGGPPSALGCGLAEHPPGVGEALPYNPSVPLAVSCDSYEKLVGGALVPHQLFVANIPLWCGTSARGAGPPSARGCRLAEHPPAVGEPLPYHPSVPLVVCCES